MTVKCIVRGRAFERSTPAPNSVIEGRGNGKSTIVLLEFMKANCCGDLCLKQWWEAINESYNEWKLPRQSMEGEAANEGDI